MPSSSGSPLIYQRILLKLSGEALSGHATDHAFDPLILHRIVAEVSELIALGAEVGIVVGGGNLCRGAQLTDLVQRVTGDQMGMLATLMNALALRDAFEAQQIIARVMSAVAVPSAIAEQQDSRRAIRHLRRGRVVIFAGGTGNPYFTTDSAASLRGIEIGAEIVFKATQVDGVYDADPRHFPEAKRFQTLTYDDVIRQDLQVMDLTAICLCRDNNIPLCVFGLRDPGILKRIMMGSGEGTLIRS